MPACQDGPPAAASRVTRRTCSSQPDRRLKESLCPTPTVLRGHRQAHGLGELSPPTRTRGQATRAPGAGKLAPGQDTLVRQAFTGGVLT